MIAPGKMDQEIESSTWRVWGTRFHHVFLVHKMFFLVHKMRRATLLPFSDTRPSLTLQGYQIDQAEHQSIATGTITKVFSSPQLFIRHFFSSTTWNQMLMMFEKTGPSVFLAPSPSRSSSVCIETSASFLQSPHRPFVQSDKPRNQFGPKRPAQTLLILRICQSHNFHISIILSHLPHHILVLTLVQLLDHQPIET